uniref:hypothetical protein n=1 Tax=Nonomuraea sp. CA-252377 TaxID=3240003 RepID=UPI003F49899A
MVSFRLIYVSARGPLVVCPIRRRFPFVACANPHRTIGFPTVMNRHGRPSRRAGWPAITGVGESGLADAQASRTGCEPTPVRFAVVGVAALGARAAQAEGQGTAPGAAELIYNVKAAVSVTSSTIMTSKEEWASPVQSINDDF